MGIGRQVGLAAENARLFALERTKHDEAERRRTVAEGLREILAVLNSNRPLQETLDSIITQTSRVTRQRCRSLLQRNLPNGAAPIQSSCGLDAGWSRPSGSRAARGSAGRSLASGPVVCGPTPRSFVDRMVRIRKAISPEKRALELMLGHGFSSALLSVPLIIKDVDYGGITLYYRRPREFCQEEIELAMTVADQAALAIENARLRDQAKQAAAFAERSRLARELHDSVTQSLYSIAYSRRRLPACSPRAPARKRWSCASCGRRRRKPCARCACSSASSARPR